LQFAGVTLSGAELPNILAHLERDPGGEPMGGLRQFWGCLEIADWPGRARRYSASLLMKRKASLGGCQ
jgi:hypothetical protein